MHVLYLYYSRIPMDFNNCSVVKKTTVLCFPVNSGKKTEYRSLAVDCVSSILWGFSARNCREIPDEFVQKQKYRNCLLVSKKQQAVYGSRLSLSNSGEYMKETTVLNSHLQLENNKQYLL